MSPKPLPVNIYNKAKELEVTSINLHFSGGNDEGSLYVDIHSNRNIKEVLVFEEEIERWAWDTYPYSGAGDGNDYGDDIHYDLENNKVKVTDWHTERVDGDTEESRMEIQ
jgi:hypothetical protein